MSCQARSLLIRIKDPLKRDFYAEMCRIEGWSTRMLRRKIDGMLYERTALSKKPEELIREELPSAAQQDGWRHGPVCNVVEQLSHEIT